MSLEIICKAAIFLFYIFLSGYLDLSNLPANEAQRKTVDGAMSAL